MIFTAHDCVLLADRHHGLSEGIRGLLETSFHAVVMVADESSLFESVARLNPEVVVVDLSLVPGGNLNWLERLRATCANVKLVVISAYDEPNVRERIMKIGVDAFVLKRSLAKELLPAIDRIMMKTHNETAEA